MFPETFEAVPAVSVSPPEPLSRSRALVEVLLCSGYPTQLVIAAALGMGGISPGADGALSAAFIFALSALDTVFLLGLVFLFLKGSNDRPRDLFLGTRPLPRELLFGILTVPALFMMIVTVQLGLRALAPFMRNVPVSPFTPLLGSPLLLAGFIVLVLVAGGLREELQRAFLLHRFEQRLGGGSLGLVVTSAAFGLGHTLQGWDAAVATGLLGACWGLM